MYIQFLKMKIKEYCGKFATEYSLPSDERVDLAARYTEPVIIQRSKEQTEKYYRDHVRSVDASSQLLSNDKNHSIRIDQLFSADGDGNTPKTDSHGDSGRGKSFMLQKIMLDWASGELYSENFDVVFLLKCEELKCIFEELNLFGLLSWSCNLISDQISHILELKPEKVLILIDGIDEYVNHPSSHSMLLLTNSSDRARPMDILRSVLKGIFLPESFLLVTTRSIAADALMNLFKGPLRFTEIMGFSERGVQEYFQKFFQDEQLFSKTYESLKANEILLTACSVPLLCWMVCFCLKKHLTDDDRVMRELKTTTSIYVLFVSTLLEHHGHSQSVLTMLRRLGQRAEEGMKKREGLFVEKSVTAAGLDPATSVFLCKDSLKRNNRKVPVFKFVHLSFQEFFTGLFYVLLDEKESWGKVRELLRSLKSKGIISRPCPERRSNPVPSVIMFLCGLLNEKASSSLFEMIKWTVPHTIKLKTDLLDLKGRQRFTEIMGFSERGVQEYFQKFFQDEQLFSKTHESLKANEILLTACSVPLLCWMVCFCLKKHLTDDDRVMRELKTTTSIYVLFVSTLLEHHGHSQSVLTMLRSLGQRAEEGMKKQEGLFVEKSVTATGLDPATSVFLCKDSLKRNNRQVPVFKFVHLSFQEFFTGLFYVLLDEKESWGKVRELLRSLKSKGIISRPCPERRSNPVPSVMMFLCGLLNEKASSSLFEMIKWTVPQIIKLKTDLLESVLTVRRQHGCELFALRCLYELQDEEFVRRALGDWVSMNLSKVSLRSTVCWVLLYCLQGRDEEAAGLS
uniref:NACHT domain-containing protein n=1 Tax=Sinocyclocheilus grahami TaxID=75366 RepID=A0A672QZV2_SINGR